MAHPVNPHKPPSSLPLPKAAQKQPRPCYSTRVFFTVGPQATSPTHAPTIRLLYNLSKNEKARVTKRKTGNKSEGPQKKKKKRRNIAQAPKKPPLHAAVHDRLHHHPATNDQRWPPIHQIIKETSRRIQNPNFHNNSSTNAETLDLSKSLVITKGDAFGGPLAGPISLKAEYGTKVELL